MRPAIADRLRLPPLILLGFGLSKILPASLLPALLEGVLDIVFLFTSALTLTLLIEIGVTVFLGLRDKVKTLHVVFSFTLGLSFFLGSQIYFVLPMLHSIAFSFILVFIIEIPYMTRYLMKLLYIIQNLGTYWLPVIIPCTLYTCREYLPFCIG